jgi:tRNA dimethylallyltransferase
MTPNLLLAVVGATAAGKSTLALELALALGGEVLNADSMQLYRGLDIGTAKLADAERRGVPHHLLDVWDVTETASVAEYQRMARSAVDDVLARGHVPVLTGGSGLYVRAVLDDLTFPGTDATVRARLEQELAAVGAGELHARLAAADPAAAAAILPGNGRRIVRALEVIETTGQPFTATLPDYRYLRPALQIGIDVALPELDRRISARVDAMFASGFVEEVRRLLDRGLRDGRTASRALGYAQVTALLDGTMSEQEARADIVRATRRFARRQRSWFRRDPRVVWLRDGPTLTDDALTTVRRTIDS